MTDSPTPSTSKTHDEKSDNQLVLTCFEFRGCEKESRLLLISMLAKATCRPATDHLGTAFFSQHIKEINNQVAVFRDLLINIGQPRDCPELREKIRKVRRTCVEACKRTSQLILPQIRSTTDIGIPVYCTNLVLLFSLIQFFLRELCKSRNLISISPMDMTDYYENRAGPSNIGTVISQIILCKQITPDFNEEEICSIRKDSEEIRELIRELQEFMPKSDMNSEKFAALQDHGVRSSRVNGGRRTPKWNNASQTSQEASYFRGAFNFFCCAARTNYV